MVPVRLFVFIPVFLVASVGVPSVGLIRGCIACRRFRVSVTLLLRGGVPGGGQKEEEGEEHFVKPLLEEHFVKPLLRSCSSNGNLVEYIFFDTHHQIF